MERYVNCDKCDNRLDTHANEDCWIEETNQILCGTCWEKAELSLAKENVAQKINDLVAEYNFPLPVLEDINRRLSDCQDPNYAAQQLRYLENVVKAGIAKKRGE